MQRGGFLYNAWNALKQTLQASDKSKNLYFRDGEVWWCHLGLNIGKEVYGKGSGFTRPVLVLKKLSDDLAVILPLTSQEKVGTWFADLLLNSEPRWALLSQICTVDKKRFQRKIGEINQNNFKSTKEKLKQLLELF